MAVYMVFNLRWRSDEEGDVVCIGEKLCGGFFERLKNQMCLCMRCVCRKSGLGENEGRKYCGDVGCWDDAEN